MPGGLQCWDANGKLIVDIGDYNTRYLGRTAVTMAANTNVVTGAFGGLTTSGSFVVVVSASSSVYYTPSNFAARALNGSFNIFKLSSYTAAVTLTLDMYAFI
ncbi:hypothetical protein [Pantoea vagans]|uniref:Uncharacterized protein n=1 Tax=Pantoea vagans TaxID=470934 RepID=A0AAN1NR66_9GAMM|nr:hypothetical protein [Pantoea vagans]AVV37842.1 hypothetical protein C9381_11835 [Pantoea vagans]